jgi:hypothetical protein
MEDRALTADGDRTGTRDRKFHIRGSLLCKC